MTREEAIGTIQRKVDCHGDTELMEALDMAIMALFRAVPCKECEHGWYRAYPFESRYYCLISHHYHAPDFFCKNGKPKLDET